MFDNLTDIPGISVGHAQDDQAKTGVTVILCQRGAAGGVDARGFAAGTRDIAPLSPSHLVTRIHALVLAGGSAYGLAAADGAMKFLEEKGVGFLIRGVRVPIVPAAVIFDLGFSLRRPDKEMGYQACLNAAAGKLAQGSVGAGTGATVGKLFGLTQAMKGGVGSASIILDGGLIVAALAVVNSFGDVCDPESGQILAGAREKGGKSLAVTSEKMVQGAFSSSAVFESTTLGVVATNAELTKAEAGVLATMGHDGLARAVRPAHTCFDGDVVFALSLGDIKADVNRVGVAGAKVLAEAIKRGVTEADSLGMAPSYRDFRGNPLKKVSP